MSRRCEKCGRGPTAGATRSHSNIKSKRRVQINLQSKKIDGKKTKICTSCMRTLAKVKK
ncbi:MAG: 50S ribosomal protein L28 [Candidatus Magasanikbacteria bacterium RIFOXYB2_FULL_38_10]|nr:MAG: 50S ribosomal protein L28 [Candidatus Magasanikbacteria bacterium RIFOXYB2_FULL_38_10]